MSRPRWVDVCTCDAGDTGGRLLGTTLQGVTEVTIMQALSGG
jgi:hypothetical protein